MTAASDIFPDKTAMKIDLNVVVIYSNEKYNTLHEVKSYIKPRFMMSCISCKIISFLAVE
jgi:hypothetical protein